LKNIWILLMMKRSILYTINEKVCAGFFLSQKKNIFDYLIKFSQKKDPFEKLNSCFKVNEDVKININFDRSLLISLAIVIFQIIEFTLSSIDDEEIRSLNESA